MFSKQDRLKRQAKKYYAKYHYELDQMDCGRALGEHMNPRVLEAKCRFNRVLDELAKLDPTCPLTRL